MSRKCNLCGKGTVISRNRSHAQNRTPREYRANVQKVTIRAQEGVISGDFCTKCIKRMKQEVTVTKDSGAQK